MNIYSAKAEERRKQFNKIINSCDLVLMNNIAEIDDSIWENWLDKSPIEQEECEWFLNDSTPLKRWCCATHRYEGDEDENENTEHPDECAWAESEPAEVFQWFATSEGDAEFLARHNQYVTYSDKLDTHFLAICHFGTAWDYTSMVDDFEDCYIGLEKLDADKKVV